MKINTKFDVNDLVQRKYDRSERNTVVIEIMEIQPVVCIAGPQIFYIGRIIVIEKNYMLQKDEEQTYTIERTVHQNNFQIKYREDELIPASKEVRELLK